MSLLTATDFIRDFEQLSPTLSVQEAQQRLQPAERGRLPYGIVLDSEGLPLTCLRFLSLEHWPQDQTLADRRDHWPPLWTLPAAEATDVNAVARFFQQELLEHDDLVGIVLVDGAGQPTGILSRRVLTQALTGGERTGRAVMRGEKMFAEPGESEFGSERELMQPRFGLLQFPDRVALQQRCRLEVSINRERLPDTPGQVELGLRARDWPVKVLITVVEAEDFLLEGPACGCVLVPRNADSQPLVFTLLPQSLGKKKVRVRFEQNNTYLGIATIKTTVVNEPPVAVAAAEVAYPPALAALVQPPDLTIYIQQRDTLTYCMSVRHWDDPPDSPARQIDQVSFPCPPDHYMEDIFDDLNRRTVTGLLPEEFDAEVRKIGSSLYDRLFSEAGFKDFYWRRMYERVRTVQIVSDEPYIPWELLRPSRQLPDGTWEPDTYYLCQRFALSRWLAGPGPASKLSLRQLVLVAPESTLEYVQAEVEDLQQLPGLQVIKIIEDKPALEQFLRSGQANALHFACHGHYRPALPARSMIELGERDFRPDELTAENRNIGRFKPLVFLNACDTGRQGIGLTGLDGWALAFLKYVGVGAFIGSMWQINDNLASRFATCFYQRLLAGDEVGEAMRTARQAIEQSGDATYLSYSLYANPTLRAARPVQ